MKPLTWTFVSVKSEAKTLFQQTHTDGDSLTHFAALQIISDPTVQKKRAELLTKEQNRWSPWLLNKAGYLTYRRDFSMFCKVSGQSRAPTLRLSLVVLFPVGLLLLKIPALMTACLKTVQMAYKCAWHHSHTRKTQHTHTLTYRGTLQWQRWGNVPLGNSSCSSHSAERPAGDRRSSRPVRGRYKSGRMGGILGDGAERDREWVKREKRGEKQAVITWRVKRTKEAQVGNKVKVIFIYIGQLTDLPQGARRG